MAHICALCPQAPQSDDGTPAQNEAPDFQTTRPARNFDRAISERNQVSGMSGLPQMLWLAAKCFEEFFLRVRDFNNLSTFKS